MSNLPELVDFRRAINSDVPFILSTFLKGLRYGNGWYKLIDSKVYFSVYHDIIVRILSKPEISVKVACLKEDPTIILGYSIVEGDRLHWVHVKKAWRHVKIATSLVPETITTVTHLTDVGKSIFLKKKLIFNPFVL